MLIACAVEAMVEARAQFFLQLRRITNSQMSCNSTAIQMKFGTTQNMKYLYKQQNRNFTYLIRVASTSNNTATAKKRKIAATAEDVDSKESLWMQEKEFRRKEHQWNEVLYNLKRENCNLKLDYSPDNFKVPKYPQKSVENSI